ncbi:hypothetical protein BJ742DRAFT_864435 [Cladochytrium replicatum]|nr:hypothetical protein BJ742DRAFT_864435 [Cladochytrium replicatum]
MYFGMFRCNVCGAIGEESVVKNHVMEHYQYPSQFQHGYLWNGASLIPVIGYRSATGVGLNSDGGMGQPAPILEYGQLLPRSQVSESAPKTRNGAPSRKLGTLEDLTCHLCGKALNSKRTLKSHLRVGADGIETCVALQGRPLTSAAATPIFSGSSSIYSNTPSHPTSAFATSAMRSPPFTVQVKKELLQTGSSQRTPENFQDAFEGGLSAVTVPNARTVAQSVVAPANVDDVEIDVLKASGGSAGHFYVQLPGRTEINRVYYVPGPSALGRTPKEMDTVNVFSRVVNDDRGISEGKMNTRAISNAQSAQKSLPKIIINEPNFTSYNGEHQHEGRKRKLAICESEDSPRGSKAVFDSESGTGYDKKQRTISNSSSGSTAFETLRHELSLTGTAQSSPLPQRSEVQTSLEQPLVQFGLCEDDELYGSNVSSFSFQDFFENHLSSE